MSRGDPAAVGEGRGKGGEGKVASAFLSYLILNLSPRAAMKEPPRDLFEPFLKRVAG